MNKTHCTRASWRWRRTRSLLIVTALPLALAGCQAMTEQWCKTADYCEMSPDDDVETPINALLEYALLVDGMDDIALNAERERLAEAVDSAACTNDHVRLALVTLGHEDHGTLTDKTLDGLAQCRDQVAVARVRAALASVLHDAHVHQAASASRIAELERSLSQQRTRNDALEEQLEALKAIERSIIERNRD